VSATNWSFALNGLSVTSRHQVIQGIINKTQTFLEFPIASAPFHVVGEKSDSKVWPLDVAK
jgi:hypothetical protein